MYEFNGFNNSESLINCWKKRRKGSIDFPRVLSSIPTRAFSQSLSRGGGIHNPGRLEISLLPSKCLRVIGGGGQVPFLRTVKSAESVEYRLEDRSFEGGERNGIQGCV